MSGRYSVWCGRRRCDSVETCDTALCMKRISGLSALCEVMGAQRQRCESGWWRRFTSISTLTVLGWSSGPTLLARRWE